MKKIILTIAVVTCMSSCNFSDSSHSVEQLPHTNFEVDNKSYSATLRYDDFMNGDGLVNRIITLEYPDKTISEFTAHVAHYSDEITLKTLKSSDKTFVIAEDKTGYTVWDLKEKKVIAQSQDMEKNAMVDTPIGTAEDFMTHKELTNQDWAKALGLKQIKETDFSSLNWTQNN